MSYQVRLDEGVIRALERLPGDIRAAIFARVQALAEQPRPSGAKPLAGALSGSYRLKVRQVYRVGFEVDDAARVVTVWGVGHRDKFYDKARRRRR